LYIAAIEIEDNDELIYELPDEEYSRTWQMQDNLENKIMGDHWMRDNKFLVFKVRSAVNPSEFNFLLNPLYPGFHDKVTVHSVHLLNIDARFTR